MAKNLALIGYSGHSYVAFDIASVLGIPVNAYCDVKEASENPFELEYLGNENDPNTLELLRGYDFFVSIGSNELRAKVTKKLVSVFADPVSLVHPSAVVSSFATLGNGLMVSPNTCINARSQVGEGAICNTGAIIEHDCKVGNFVHVAPGAVLGGNVEVGSMTLIGANSVVKPGVKIGSNVTVGAGSVVIQDVKDGSKIVGNPTRMI